MSQEATAPNNLLRVRGLTKRYPGVLALGGVDFDVHSHEVHCLVGENGAGKSTLIEIVAGSIRRDDGIIEVQGRPAQFGSPKEAQDAGIAVLHQELPVLPEMTVAENICLSRIPTNPLGLVSYRQLNRQAKKWLDLIESNIDPRTLLGNLPVAKQQLVSIAKSLSLEANIIILDEPSAVLTLVELEHLFRVIRTLRDQGKGIVYISHRLDEIFEIGDRVTVLRNGRLIASSLVSNVGKSELVQQMVGREVSENRLRTRSAAKEREVVLAVRGMTRKPVFQDVSFELEKGEILGIFGLVGAGRTEVVRALVGADKFDSGTVEYQGSILKIRSPRSAIKNGICLAPEDRKRQGVLLDKSIRENVALPRLRQLSRCGLVLDQPAITRQARESARTLRIAAPSVEVFLKNLSGGNQQKVVLAKWLGLDMQVLIFDEPTRGVDVGAKEEIRKLIVDLAVQGRGIIVISSEIPEILAISDRVLVMHGGRIAGNMPVEQATQEKLVALAMGG
jgi:ribose transport system ATP-binding protein